MQLSEALAYSFEEIRHLVDDVVQDLHTEALVWRPDPDANSIAWLVWHLTRVQDDHVSEIAGRQQVWNSEGWAVRFGLPADYMDTGFGHSSEQVGDIDPPDRSALIEYHNRVGDRTSHCLEGLGTQDFDRIIDRSYDPPVTVGVRLISVIHDALQHAGQAAYVRGLFERRR